MTVAAKSMTAQHHADELDAQWHEFIGMYRQLKRSDPEAAALVLQLIRKLGRPR